jgi:hypothetical protein
MQNQFNAQVIIPDVLNGTVRLTGDLSAWSSRVLSLRRRDCSLKLTHYPSCMVDLLPPVAWKS